MSKLFVDEIVHQSSQGSGTITLGASGEKVDLGTGVSGGTLTNTPSFRIYSSDNQTISHSTATKVGFNTTEWDTNSGVDLTNDRFTVPSGGAGKYYLLGEVLVNTDNDFRLNLYIYKNGSEVRMHGGNHQEADDGMQINAVIDLAVGDYVELYCWQNAGVNKTIIGGTRYKEFHGFRLIG